MCAYKGDDVSRKAFLAMMASYLNADSVTFRDGIGILPKTLARYFEVELMAQAKGINLKSDGSDVDIRYSVGGQSKAVSADRIVVAVQGNHILSLSDDPRHLPSNNSSPRLLTARVRCITISRRKTTGHPARGPSCLVLRNFLSTV